MQPLIFHNTIMPLDFVKYGWYNSVIGTTKAVLPVRTWCYTPAPHWYLGLTACVGGGSGLPLNSQYREYDDVYLTFAAPPMDLVNYSTHKLV